MLDGYLTRDFCALLEPELTARIFELRRVLGDAAMLAQDVAVLSRDETFIYARDCEPVEHKPLREVLQKEITELSYALRELHEDAVSMSLNMTPPPTLHPARVA